MMSCGLRCTTASPLLGFFTERSKVAGSMDLASTVQDFGESANVALYAVEGPATSIIVEMKPAEHIGPAGRITASLCLAGVVCLFILGLRRGTWATILKDRPCTVGIAAGLAWWCWLWPSVLGMVVMLVCLVAWWIAHRKKTAAGVLE